MINNELASVSAPGVDLVQRQSEAGLGWAKSGQPDPEFWQLFCRTDRHRQVVLNWQGCQGGSHFVHTPEPSKLAE